MKAKNVFFTLIMTIVITVSFSCRKLDTCPKKFDLGYIEIGSKYYEFLPYSADDSVTFINESQEELIFKPTVNQVLTNAEVKEDMECVNSENLKTEVSYSYDFQHIYLCASDDLCINAVVNIGRTAISITEPLFDKNKPENIFLKIVHYGLSPRDQFSPWGIEYSNFIDKDTPRKPSRRKIDSLNVLGTTYENVFVVDFVAPFNPYENIFISEKVGIIKFILKDGEEWNLKN